MLFYCYYWTITEVLEEMQKNCQKIYLWRPYPTTERNLLDSLIAA